MHELRVWNIALRTIMLGILALACGGCRFQGLSLGEGFARAVAADAIRHTGFQRLAMVLVVERLCGCGEAELAGAGGQVFEFDKEFPCGDFPDSTWLIHVIGVADFGESLRGAWTRETYEASATETSSYCVRFRDALKEITPVGQVHGDLSAIYVGNGTSAIWRVLCLTLERPERPGVITVTILSVDRATDSNSVALRG